MCTQNTSPPGFETAQVLTVSAGHFVHDVFSSFLAPWLPLMIDKLDLSLTLAGCLTLFVRLPSLLNPFIGAVADRVDMRFMVIVPPAVTGVCMSLVGLAPNYGVLAALLFAVGLSAAVFHVPGPVLIAQTSGARIGKGMSFFMAGGELARTVGPLVAVAVVSLWGFEGSYPVMTVGLLASGLLYWRFRHAGPQAGGRHYSPLVEAWRSMQSVLIPLTCLILARALMVASLGAFLPTFMVARGKGLWFGGTALAVLQFAGVLGAMASGTFSDRLGRRFVLFLAMIASPLLMLVFLAVPTWGALPVLFVLGLTVFATTPVMLAIVQDHAHGTRATANGIYMGVDFVVISGVTVLVGWMGDHIGLGAAFGWSAILALLGIPVIHFLPTRRP